MPASPPLDERRAALLTHLDSAYTLAKALARDDDRAVHLVEATYAQAFVTMPLNYTEQEDKRWLLQLLREIHHEQEAFDWPEPMAEAPADADALDAFRQRLAVQVAERTLPAVFAGLPEQQRLVLLLCEVEALSCADAAEVLDLDDETACHLLDEARDAITQSLHAGVAPMEQQVLDAYLSDDDLREALRRTVESAYGPAPTSLRSSVLEATETTRPPARDEKPESPAQDPPRLKLPPTAARPPERASTPRRGAFGPSLRRLGLTLLLVGVVGFLGYMASRSLEQEPETNLIALAVAQADAVRPALPTNSPQQAEAYVLDHLDWRLTLPAIDDATLTGVSVHEIVPGVRAPAFLYADHLTSEDEPPIVLYIFTYALLDQHADRLELEAGIRRQIQEDDRFDLHDLGERQVLIWRNRDDVYVAVTAGDAESLRQRIVMPS